MISQDLMVVVFLRNDPESVLLFISIKFLFSIHKFQNDISIFYFLFFRYN